jgi:hypothetical protein
MAQSNFQDVVVLNQATLTMGVEQQIIGTDAGSKSLVFAQDPAQASALFLVASNPTAQNTIILPAANGTVGLITNVEAAGGTITNGAVSFANSNGVSFGVNGSTVTASVAASAAAVLGIGVSTGGNTAGNTGTTNGTYVLVGAGIVSLSQVTAAGSLATLTISATQSTAPAGLGVPGSTITNGTIVFSDSNGVSFGINGSTVTASVAAAAAASVTAFSQWAEWNTNWSISQASFSLQRFTIPMNLSATQMNMMMALSGATNSSGAITISVGIYTIGASTASLASSASVQISWTSGSATNTSSEYGGASGTRYRTLAVGFSMTPGDYMMGFLVSTTNNGTWQVFGRNGVNIVGSYEGDTNAFLDGTSISSTGGLLASVAQSNTNYARTGIGALRQPGFILLGTGG